MRKAYPKYKPSGVAWIGDIPDEWRSCAIRFCLSDIFNGLTSPQLEEGPDTVPVTRIETISTGKINEDKLGFINSKDSREDRKLKAGDILFSNINSLNMIGNCAHYHGGREIYAGMNLLVLRPAQDSSPKWLYWLIRSSMFRQVVESFAKPAINQASISQSSVSSIIVPIPSVPVQFKIAQFLDDKTSKLDTLIAKKTEFIDRLKEKRTALISQVVTKGLPPEEAKKHGLPVNPKMKPSGVEWLGEIPEHWGIDKLSRVSKFKKGPNAAELNKEYISENIGQHPVYSGQTENEGLMGMIDSYSFSFYAPVVFVTTVGAKAMTTRLVSGKFSLSQNCALIIPKPSFSAVYLENSLQPLFSYERASISTIMQPSLRFEDLSRFWIPTPPVAEQEIIGNYLQSECEKIRTIIEKTEEALRLLNEYRSALITAAVTGKIDVREVAA